MRFICSTVLRRGLALLVLLASAVPLQAQPLADFFPPEDATHTAVQDGPWSDPATWDAGAVPGTGAIVYIPAGRAVIYDAASTDRLFGVRVDGRFEVAPDRSTRLYVDTFVSLDGSTVTFGTVEAPVAPDVTAEVFIAGDGPIDRTWDPGLLSRGLVLAGTTRMHGAERLPYATLAGDAYAGDAELVLAFPDGATTPTGWQVGDQLVLAGTDYDPEGDDADNSRFQDEVLTITAIDGNRIRFTNDDTGEAALRFDHVRPAGFEAYDLAIHVANLTRNVRIRTADAATVPTQERGHVMFMLNPDVDVRYAGFYNLGRSDKNRLVDDVGENVDGSPGGGTNPRGRYLFHFHRNGADDWTRPAAYARGNAVAHGPGWGIVHHDSHVILEENVVFDVVGSGIAAEAGNEIGRWSRNLTIKTTGDDDPAPDFDGSVRMARFDMGFNGEGYWVQGAGQVEMEDNIAVSAAGGGINIFSGVDGIGSVRDKDTVPRSILPPEFQYITDGADAIDVTNTPLRRFTGFTCYNSDFGIVFWNHMRNDDGVTQFTAPGLGPAHDARSRVEGFRLWSIYGEGVFTQYSTQIDFVDGLVVGDPAEPVPHQAGINGAGRGHGVSNNGPAQDQTFQNLRIEGFTRGMRLPREGGSGSEEDRGLAHDWLGSRVTDSYFANNTYHLAKDQSGFGAPRAFPAFFQIERTTFVPPAGANTPPVATFAATNLGGANVVHLDASAAYDPDPDDVLGLSGNAIASYAWDLDADGAHDVYGQDVYHAFPAPGTYDVTLTVWDHQGATTSQTQAVVVEAASYANLVRDPDFSGTEPFGGAPYALTVARADEDWIARNFERQDGAAVLTGSGGTQGIGQVIMDRHARRGLQTLSVDLRNTEGDADPNELLIRLWGSEQEFQASLYTTDLPEPYDATAYDGTLIFEAQEGGASFDWTTFQYEVDLGDGHRYLYLEILATNGPDPAAGDAIAIDNVFLADADQIGVVPPPEVGEPGLIAAYDLDEGTGRTAFDGAAGGTPSDLTLFGGATWTGGVDGTAVAFDGDAAYVWLEDSPDFNEADFPKRTVALWVRVDDPALTSRRQIVYEEGSGSNGLSVYVHDDTLHVGGRNTAAGWDEATWLRSGALVAGQWHHVALVLDGGPSLAPEAFRAYLDGEEVGRGPGSQRTASWPEGALGNAKSGGVLVASGYVPDGGGGLGGAIDLVRIYDRALTAAQIDSLRRSALPDVNLTIAPDDATLAVPPEGGTYAFTVTATNNTAETQVRDVWLNIAGPEGISVTRGPLTITLAAGRTAERVVTQNVPGGAPPGTYNQSVRLGTFPLAEETASFTWTKDAAASMPARITTWDTFVDGAPLADVTSVSEAEVPRRFELAGNYPNPFNPQTVIRYALPAPVSVRLEVFDLLGRRVATLVEGRQPAGWHTATFDAADLASGLYLYRLEAGTFSQVRTMLLVK